MSARELEHLQARLASVPPGELTYQDANDVESSLAGCWGDLKGWREGGMTGRKLIGRAEELQWHPPVLTFRIERHGGYVSGSTRAELQTWAIDVNAATANLISTSHRQLIPMDARLDVKSLATETAKKIYEGREVPELGWAKPTRVRILTGKIIPATNRQTTAGRRRRFARALETLLTQEGWHRIDAGSHLIFERAPKTE